MSRLDARLAKLENITHKKPVIWAFVPKPADNTIAELEKDKDMLREFAGRYFGVTDFYFTIISPPPGVTLSFTYMEHSDFQTVIESIPKRGSSVNNGPAPSGDTRERNEILADYLERFLDEIEAEQ